jgi:hypothetical protein
LGLGWASRRSLCHSLEISHSGVCIHLSICRRKVAD